MTTSVSSLHESITQRQAAMIAGIALVLMALLAGFAYGFVFTSLVVPGNASVTAQNIKNSETLFRAGVMGWLMILLLDVVVAWALYIFLNPIHKSLSRLVAWLRLVYASLLGIALLNLVVVLALLSGADYLNVLDASTRNAQILLFLNAFSGMWSLGLVVFGFHLLVLGYTVVLSQGVIPQFLGVLLLVAAVCYILTSAANVLLPNYDTYKPTVEMITSVPMAIGELAFAVWLWAKGGKTSVHAG
ncbi:MAG: DUF4386 domain-containing protein [Candidatus Kapaibacteriota bacterium]